MQYEYLIEKLESLRLNPISAQELMKTLNKNKFYPITITVDNNSGKILITFENKLQQKDKEKLDEIIHNIIISL